MIPGERETLVYHEGRETGIYTLCVLLPKSKKAVVVLTNGNNGELFATRLIKTVLPSGSIFVRAKSRELWKTLQAMSGDELAEIIPVIASSPTYMGTVFAAVESDSNASDEKLENAKDVFGHFLSGMIDGELKKESAVSVLNQIIEQDATNGPRLAPTIDLERFDRVVETASRQTNQSRQARPNHSRSQ